MESERPRRVDSGQFSLERAIESGWLSLLSPQQRGPLRSALRLPAPASQPLPTPSPPRPLNEHAESLCLPLPSTCCLPAAPAPPLSARDLSQQLPPGKEEDPAGWERCPGEKGLGGTKDPVNYSETQAVVSKEGGAVPPRAGVAPLFQMQAAPSPARSRSLERQECGSVDHPWAGSEPPKKHCLSQWRLQRGSPLNNPSFPTTLPLLSPFCTLETEIKTCTRSTQAAGRSVRRLADRGFGSCSFG